MVAKNILFIGLSSVGDALMTTPVMQSLLNHYPGSKFDIVTDNRSVGLYDNCPFARNLFIKDKNRFLRGVPDLYSKLFLQRYDVIVDLRTDGLAYLLRGKKKFTKWKASSYGEHAVEDLMGVIASLHGDEPIPDTMLWLSDEQRKYANEMLSVFEDKSCLLALSVGDPGKPFKTWSLDKFVELLQNHKQDFSGLVFLGGPSEHECTEKVIHHIDTPSINVTGNSLLESAALIEQCNLYLGPDSGLGHIAAAVKTPTISFFSLMKPERFRPWGVKSFCIQGKNDDARNILVSEVSTAIKEFYNE